MKTPLPLFFSYDSSDQLLEALSEPLQQKYKDEIKRLEACNLPPFVSYAVLSTSMGVSVTLINAIVKNKKNYYRTFTISKGKNKKKRVIEAPKVALKIMQSWFAYHLSRSNNINISNSAFGFLPGVNGIYEAAKKHCGSKWIFSIDLKDFFHSIDKEKTASALSIIGYTAQQANKISEIITYNNHLPQGAPSSPVISNIAFKETDMEIENAIDGMNINYTRYADDLTFSGSDANFDIEKLKTTIIEIIERNNWTIAPDKTRISRHPNRLKVHGFLVHEEKPRLTKGYRNKLRTYKHLASVDKINTEDKDKINGHINYGNYIDRLNSD